MFSEVEYDMDKQIADFLIRAKKATYAGKGAEADPSRPNSHDLHYAEGSLKYIDSYLGGIKFSGEEAMWDDDVPFWSMNYAGRVIADGFSGEFLKEALSHVPRDYPFRGPANYVSGDYTYSCGINGDFHWFSGMEEIYFKKNKVYECMFHGGDVE
jgi:hypothetical protein